MYFCSTLLKWLCSLEDNHIHKRICNKWLWWRGIIWFSEKNSFSQSFIWKIKCFYGLFQGWKWWLLCQFSVNNKLTFMMPKTCQERPERNYKSSCFYKLKNAELEVSNMLLSRSSQTFAFFLFLNNVGLNIRLSISVNQFCGIFLTDLSWNYNVINKSEMHVRENWENVSSETWKYERKWNTTWKWNRQVSDHVREIFTLHKGVG